MVSGWVPVAFSLLIFNRKIRPFKRLWNKIVSLHSLYCFLSFYLFLKFTLRVSLDLKFNFGETGKLENTFSEIFSESPRKRIHGMGKIKIYFQFVSSFMSVVLGKLFMFRFRSWKKHQENLLPLTNDKQDQEFERRSKEDFHIEDNAESLRKPKH